MDGICDELTVLYESTMDAGISCSIGSPDVVVTISFYS